MKDILHILLIQPKIELKLSDLDVVRDFPDVFLDELPRVILDREVEFSIELFTVTTPISIVPHRRHHLNCES